MLEKKYTIEEPFVTLEVAKVLKENGFEYSKKEVNKREYKLENGETYPAPSYSLAMSWIEKNFYFHISTTPRSWEEDVVKWSAWADELKLHYFMLAVDDRQDEPYDTKEEAIDNAIIYILTTLAPRFKEIYKEKV